MKNAWKMFSDLLDVARGRRPDDLGPAQGIRLMAGAALSSLAFVGAWGLAAGSTDALLALSNAAKVPMVLLFSVLAALPAGLLAHRLSDSPESTRSLLLTFAGSIFAGSLVAAVLAPLVAVYYVSSAWAGPYLGIGSAFLAVAVAALLLLRSGAPEATPADRKSRLIPKLVFAVVTLGVMPQFIALASPILPEHTIFDEGIDIVDVMPEVG